MVRALILALDDRLGAAPFLKHALRKAFPDHWSFMLGELAAYCFIFIVATGVYLTLFFHPSDARTVYLGSALPSLHGRTMSDAYASVLNLSFQVRAGLLIRQAHHWCALLFAAAVTLHMARVFFTGAFRKPRDINWLVGTTLLVLVLVEGFTGYSLPGDALSGAGLRIAQAVAYGIPVIGSWVAYMFFGSFPGPNITNRLFSLHAVLFPATLAGLLGLHVAILWRQKHSQFPGRSRVAERTEHNVVGSPLWPRYALKSTALMLGTFAVLFALGAFVEINPVWQYGPFDPWTTPAPAQPDWYVGWLEGALRIAPPMAMRAFGHTVSGVFWPAILLPTMLFALMYAWPWLERLVSRDRAEHELLQFPWQNPVRTGFGACAFTFVGLLVLAGGDDVQARIFGMSVQELVLFYRIAVFVLPPLAGLLAWQICRELRSRHAHEDEIKERVLITRNAEGGYEEEAVIPTPP